MRAEIERLYDKAQTAAKIKKIVRNYSGDLNRIFLQRQGQKIPLSKLPIGDFFNFIKNVRYKRDKKPVELVTRPAVAFSLLSGIDCKKKAVIVGSYLKENNIPYRFIGVSNRPDRAIHHVFPQAKIGNDWINIDATYPHYKIAESKRVTKWEVL